MTETLVGYVVDLACLRAYPQNESRDRAQQHTRDCCLMGHCIESGYGLVDEEGGVIPLDSEATALVEKAIRQSSQTHGIKLRITRSLEGEKMTTRQVEEIQSEQTDDSKGEPHGR